jgi:hypothetical protein
MGVGHAPDPTCFVHIMCTMHMALPLKVTDLKLVTNKELQYM